MAFLTRFDTRPANFFAAIGTVVAGGGVAICSYVTVLWFSGVRPIGDRPLLLLGVLLIVVGCQCLGLGLLAELVVRVRSTGDEPRLIARIVTGQTTPTRIHGCPDSVSGTGP